MSAIVLAGAKRLGALLGFPVQDFALVPETDLDIDEIRDRLWHTLAGRYLDVVPGDREGQLRSPGSPASQRSSPSSDDPGRPDLGVLAGPGSSTHWVAAVPVRGSGFRR